ncbi:putative alliinase, EGF-like domain, pyridoxal phosphate-dependent transferase [Helianthus debilis subsp. tardiflorus]
MTTGDGPNQEISCRLSLTWSEKAATEAEAVATISCSGHGRAFLDGSISDGQPVCECYGCYSGTDCSELSAGCAADANSGDPIYLEPFWMQNAVDTAVVISGWHRLLSAVPLTDLLREGSASNDVTEMMIKILSSTKEDSRAKSASALAGIFNARTDFRESCIAVKTLCVVMKLLILNLSTY